MDVSLRVITDHIRASTFMIADGVPAHATRAAAMCSAACFAGLPVTASSWV